MVTIVQSKQPLIHGVVDWSVALVNNDHPDVNRKVQLKLSNVKDRYSVGCLSFVFYLKAKIWPPTVLHFLKRAINVSQKLDLTQENGWICGFSAPKNAKIGVKTFDLRKKVFKRSPLQSMKKHIDYT